MLKEIIAATAAETAHAVPSGTGSIQTDDERPDKKRHSTFTDAAPAAGAHRCRSRISRSCSRSYSVSGGRSGKNLRDNSRQKDEVGYSDSGNDDGDNGADFAPGSEKEDVDNQPNEFSSAPPDSLRIAAPASRTDPNPLDDFFAERPISSPSKVTASYQSRIKDINPPHLARPSPRRESDGKSVAKSNGWQRSRSRGREGRTRVEKRVSYEEEHRSAGDRPKVQLRGERERREEGMSPQAKCPPQILETKIDEFCRKNELQEKVKKMMCNMFEQDALEILRLGSQVKEARNPTGFVISQIRTLEARAGRPMGMRTHEHAGREEGNKPVGGAGSSRGNHGEPQRGHPDVRPRAGSGRRGRDRSERRHGKLRDARPKASRMSRTPPPPPPRRPRARSDGDHGDRGRCNDRGGCDARRLTARPNIRGGAARSHR